MELIDPRAWQMTEDCGPDSLDAMVRRLIGEYGLSGYRNPDSRRAQKGFPDWLIWGKWMLARELKSQTGTLKPEQRKTGHELQRAGTDWGVWRPVDYFNGTIHRQLERIAW